MTISYQLSDSGASDVLIASIIVAILKQSHPLFLAIATFPRSGFALHDNYFPKFQLHMNLTVID